MDKEKLEKVKKNRYNVIGKDDSSAVVHVARRPIVQLQCVQAFFEVVRWRMEVHVATAEGHDVPKHVDSGDASSDPRLARSPMPIPALER